MRSWKVLALLPLSCLNACRVSPEAMERRHWELNDSIRRTSSEQLLLNLVRLRYGEMPYFLQVSTVSTTFSAQQSAEVSGSLSRAASANSGLLGAGAGVSYAENPTVTWSLPDSREYLGRLLAPMGADQLTVLAQAGWDPRRVLLAGVKKMNRLCNRDLIVGEGVYTPASYEGFVEVLQLLNQLRREDLVDLAYGVKSSQGGGKIPLERLDSRSIPDGLPYGLQFMTRDDPNVFEPLKLTKPLFLRFSKRSDADPRAQRLRSLLGLAPDRYSFGIVDTGSSGTEQLLSESGRLSQVYDPERPMAEIVLNNRSVMEVLLFVSASVQVPPEHVARGYVAQRQPLEGNWLEVRVSAAAPEDAWLKVEFHGWWFWVAANDLASRESFTLLEALFASVVGNVPGAKPLLTLPVD